MFILFSSEDVGEVFDYFRKTVTVQGRKRIWLKSGDKNFPNWLGQVDYYLVYHKWLGLCH